MKTRLAFDAGSIERSLRYIPDNMSPALAKAINDIARQVQETARSKDTHRFISRSGNLERSGIDMEEAKPEELSGKVLLNE